MLQTLILRQPLPWLVFSTLVFAAVLVLVILATLAWLAPLRAAHEVRRRRELGAVVHLGPRKGLPRVH